MTITSNVQRVVPLWEVTIDEYSKIVIAAGPRLVRFPDPTLPMIFSCSSNGVWPTTKLGFMPKDSRQYLTEDDYLLIGIAQVMMSDPDSRTGGRFSVTLNGAFRTRDGMPIVDFELAP